MATTSPWSKRRPLRSRPARPGGSGIECDGERCCFVVVEEQHRLSRRTTESVAVIDATIGVHRVSELAQSFDVAPNRPFRYLEVLGKIRSRPVAATL